MKKWYVIGINVLLVFSLLVSYGSTLAQSGIEDTEEDIKNNQKVFLPLVIKPGESNNLAPNIPSSPNPTNLSVNHSTYAGLSWEGGDPNGDNVTYDVYFDANDATPDQLVSNDQTALSYNPGLLETSTTYYWQIIATDEHGAKTSGPVWSFSTETINRTNMPSNPSPINSAAEQALSTTLSWSVDAPYGNSVTFDVYFAANDATPDQLVSNDQAALSYDPGTLEANTNYYWQIISTDENGAITYGPVWSFSTITQNRAPTMPSSPSPDNGAANLSVFTTLSWLVDDLDGDSVTNDIYFEANDATPDQLVSSDQFTQSYDPGKLEANTTYYWQIVATDEHDLSTSGPVWSFTTDHGVIPGEMVTIPAGTFQMGCDPNNNAGYDCRNQEVPLHAVYLDTYQIDRYEVTNAEYAQCVADHACEPPNSDSSYTRSLYYDNPLYENYPVVWASWYNANDYCSWVGKRLPTEAEWEKAARGSADTRAYPWGDSQPTCDLANYEGCVGDTVEVGSIPAGASLYGVMNMTDNVNEWVLDWYDENYYSISPANNPQGPENGVAKGVRGGIWMSDGEESRLSRRWGTDPAFENTTRGIRCAASIPGNTRPNIPASPVPSDAAANQTTSPTLSWSGGDADGDNVIYDVYFEADDTSPDRLVSNDQTGLSYEPGVLAANTTYYWQIIATDEHGAGISSPVWSFTTGEGDFISGEMITIPEGNFQMGYDLENNGDCTQNDDAIPLHDVYLDEYLMDRYEVTNDQYAQCVADGACDPPASNESHLRSSYYDNPTYANFPVLYVSWYNANDYCSWAGKRLPTEAEWEKAARGSMDTRTYTWGDTRPSCDLANTYPCIDDTAEVGSYPAGVSPYGVMDMTGNVWEWVFDWYDEDYYSTSPLNNPQGPEIGTNKVARGGGWHNDYYSVCVPYRVDTDPSKRDSSMLGFRCAADAP